MTCTVSVDSSWQKRGHTSLNDIVSIISTYNGKCLDYDVLSKKCHSCAMWKHKKQSPQYVNWKLNHVCQANHAGSSGSMEAIGAVKMFSRSISENNLMYTEYIGDGDTTSFNQVQLSKPYGEILITKLKCIGHIQKHVGTHCRNIRITHKNKKLSNGKGVSGLGRLSEKAINTLQNYFGRAVRQNIGNIYLMKKFIWATLFHNTNFFDENVRHQFFPRNKDSWCLWQADKITVWHDLTTDLLLLKCLHGQTQNRNECLNSMVWKKCPKEIFVSRKLLEIGICSAIIEFNDGKSGLTPIIQVLGLPVSKFMLNAFRKSDTDRIKNIQRKSSTKGIRMRKKLRAIRKGFLRNIKIKRRKMT
ncbi:uncharacterized protein LOC136078561 [Hydra vulgaris]|uniref:Uncharacterized protein LOC136078561 n=1 Tax=Hydra vulgaris TaxID=6087 RepID=A0ABM4BMU7_HYDVU